MTLLTLGRRVVATLALLCLAAPVSTAAAASPAPGCAGLAFSDERGDVPAEAGPTATNLDITDGFFKMAGGKVYATMMVDEMSLTPPPPATAVTWYMTWVVKDTTYYVSLDANLAGETTYEHGTYGPNATGSGFSYTPSGTTTGEVVEGPDGSITWVVPGAAKGSSGQVLTAPAGQTFQLVQNGLGGGVLLFGDETEAETGRSYSVGACENGVAAPDVAAPVTAPVAAALPAPVAAQDSPVLPLKLATKSAKRKRGTVLVKLKSTAAVTKVAARLRKGKKSFGTGKAASIAAGKTKALKIKARKAKKGMYILDVTARLADGRTASAAYKLRVR